MVQQIHGNIKVFPLDFLTMSTESNNEQLSFHQLITNYIMFTVESNKLEAINILLQYNFSFKRKVYKL